jgi:hypothetical protein
VDSEALCVRILRHTFDRENVLVSLVFPSFDAT